MLIIYPAETNNGVVTSWIPLSTAWPSSSGCADSFRLDGLSLMAFDPGYSLNVNPSVTCEPPEVTTWWEQGLLGGGDSSGHTAVSIGPLVCPESFLSRIIQARLSGVSQDYPNLSSHTNLTLKEVITWRIKTLARWTETACQLYSLERS